MHFTAIHDQYHYNLTPAGADSDFTADRDRFRLNSLPVGARVQLITVTL